MSTHYDVVVVGAGIMGITSAYHLQKNNPEKRVLVLDRYGAPGQGNTGRSNAMFRNTFSSSDNQLLADSSIEFYLHIQRDLKNDIGLQKIGYLWLMDERQLSKSEPHLKKMEANGIETKRYATEEVGRFLPGLVTSFVGDADAELMRLPPVDGAIFGSKCGRVDPDKLVRFYAEAFVGAGGEFGFDTEVESVLLGPTERLGVDGEPLVWQDFEVEGVAVKGKEEKISAETVVLAGGAWINELLEPIGVDGHVKAKKRQMFTVHADGPKLQKLIHSKGFNPLGLLPMVVLPKAGVHFKPASEESSIWIGCEDEVNRPFIDLPEHDLTRYEAETGYYERGIFPVLSSYFPDFKGARMKAMWAGLYAYNTMDNVPIVFRNHNLMVVGGDSGSGIMKGDAIGRVADALYREVDEVELYGGRAYRASRLGLENRDVEREEWTL